MHRDESPAEARRDFRCYALRVDPRCQSGPLQDPRANRASCAYSTASRFRSGPYLSPWIGSTYSVVIADRRAPCPDAAVRERLSLAMTGRNRAALAGTDSAMPRVRAVRRRVERPGGTYRLGPAAVARAIRVGPVPFRSRGLLEPRRTMSAAPRRAVRLRGCVFACLPLTLWPFRLFECRPA